MLDQLGRHGGFDLTVKATGDLHVDSHHTVEDTAIVLGEAFREALGDKAGVRRFASGRFPLDEALVDVALDLSGRPFVVWEVDLPEAIPLGTPPFDPSLAEHASPASPPPPASRCTSRWCGAATCTTSSRRRSRAWPAACATPCGSTGAGVPSHQGRRCERMDRPLVAVLDYGIGNLRSAQKALERVGADARLTADRGLIGRRRRRRAARRGQLRRGAWRRCATPGLDDVALDAIDGGRPFLGICVGMQMLFDGQRGVPRRRRASASCPARCAGCPPA